MRHVTAKKPWLLNEMALCRILLSGLALALWPTTSPSRLELADSCRPIFVRFNSSPTPWIIVLTIRIIRPEAILGHHLPRQVEHLSAKLLPATSPPPHCLRRHRRTVRDRKIMDIWATKIRKIVQIRLQKTERIHHNHKRPGKMYLLLLNRNKISTSNSNRNNKANNRDSNRKDIMVQDRRDNSRITNCRPKLLPLNAMARKILF